MIKVLLVLLLSTSLAHAKHILVCKPGKCEVIIIVEQLHDE